jgi:hypothetical protein
LPNVSLNLADDNQQFLTNRGTTAQRLALTPVVGGQYFDTTLNIPFVWNGSTWLPMADDIEIINSTVTWGGIFTGPVVTGPATFLRVGKTVTATFGSASGIADTPVVALQTADIAFPVANEAATFVQIEDNFVTKQGTAFLGGGVLSIQVCEVSGFDIIFTDNWSGTGESGVTGFSITYLTV